MIALALLLAAAPDPFLARLEPGMDRAAALRALDGVALTSTRGPSAKGLIRTGLLEHLNHFGLAPVEPSTGELDAAAFAEIATAGAAPHRRYTLAFDASGRLRFVLARIPLAPDVLAARKGALAELGRAGLALAPATRDAYGNTFTWEARGARVRYAPADDELVVLRFLPR